MNTTIAEEKEYNDKFYYKMESNNEFVTTPSKIRNKMKHLTPKKKKRK